MEKFKVGQRVECLLYGWGTIKYIKDFKMYDYPIKFEFDNGKNEHYTRDGRLTKNSNITLSPYGWKVSEKEPEFKEGELVWVKKDGDETWNCRYYAYCKNGKHNCYEVQKKNGETHAWDFIKKFDDIPF
jgi:hypothetical protein